MPIYKVTQKQGNRSITSTFEAKNVSSLITFLETVSTAKIMTIYEVHYNYEGDVIPVDDFQYWKQYKAFAVTASNHSKQVLVHNVKNTISEDEMATYIKQYLEVGGASIEGVACRLFMKN